MFNEANVRDSVYKEYYYIASAAKKKGKSTDKLYVVNIVLDNLIASINDYNKDELIVAKNILVIAKGVITTTSRYQIIAQAYKEKNKALYMEAYEKYKSLSKS